MVKKALISTLVFLMLLFTSVGFSIAAPDNHGKYVSGVAKGTAPGPEHGKTVSEAARNKQSTIANYALNFDGINDHVIVPDSASLRFTDQISLEAWVYLEEAVGIHAYLNKQVHGNVWFLRDSDGVFEFEPALSRGARVTYTPAVFPVNQWVHIAGTFDGSYAKLYINGELKSQRYVPGTVDNNSDPLAIGINYPGYLFGNPTFVDPQAHDGLMDDVRVWNKALTQSEILANMGSEIGPQSGLVAYWKLNEGSGLIAGDSSENGNNGTLVNDPIWIAR